MLNPLSRSCNSIESCYVIDPLTGKATSSQPLSQTMASNDSNCLAPPKVLKKMCSMCNTRMWWSICVPEIDIVWWFTTKRKE